MKGLSELMSIILLIGISVSLASLVFLYFQTGVGEVSSQVEEIGASRECFQKASIEIVDFNGKNITVRNNGGVTLNLSTFNIYSLYEKISFTYNDADGLLKPGEKIIFSLSSLPGLGPLRVTGECGVGDEIDLRYLSS